MDEAKNVAELLTDKIAESAPRLFQTARDADMTKAWITNSRDRRSKKYLARHEQLRAELERDKQPLPDKSSRKRERSRVFHQTGGTA